MCRCVTGECSKARYEATSHTYGAQLRDIETLVSEQADPQAKASSNE